MVFKRFLGSKVTRSLTVASVLLEMKRALNRGNNVRALLLLGVAVLAWQWAVIGLVAQGLASVIRRGSSSDSGSKSRAS
ncbi:hypothetical protein [Natrialba aegyptia]|uniref:Polyphosphate kinase n=1 Tax=Natrialba aegyptia DSM 13077 TaxID=1227491 RepID=M0BBC6_9EURY|nr:hypothetical protein [Natrialba aegyptia]ELZ06954.1 polyphosphate kinase [Natrialba aegyptia DSM 13077]